MKRAALLAGLVLAASPATAGPVGDAVSNTVATAVRADVAAQGGDAAAQESAVTKAINWIKQVNTDAYNSTCNAGKKWLCMAVYLEWPSPVPISAGTRSQTRAGGGSFGGGGATGSWDDNGFTCDDFDYKVDADNNLIVPSIRLAGNSIPLVHGSTGFTPVWSTGVVRSGVSATWHTAKSDASQLWQLHNANYVRGSDKRNWIGVYGWTTNVNADVTFLGGSQSYYNTAGTKVARTNLSNLNVFEANRMSSMPSSCPQGGGGGTDFHFYQARNSAECVMYAPNYSISSSGYYYPETTSIPYLTWITWPNTGTPETYRSCPLDRDFLRRLAETLWDKAGDKPGYDGPTPGPITPDEVTVCNSYAPKVDDLDEQPTIPDPCGSPTPVPDPSPTPTPTPTSSPGTTFDPGTVTEPVAPEIDWWPDLPTVSLSFGSPACPTYDMSVPQFGWVLTLDAHCPLIEANRALIGTIMILMFSVGAILIVLRA